MSRLFLTLCVAFLFIINVRSQQKLTYETGFTLAQQALEASQQEKYEVAIGFYKRISPNDSLYASSFVTISYYNLLQEKYEEALQAINKGLEVANPSTRLGLYLNKGISYEGLKSYEKAKETYEEALKEYPKSYKLRYNLSIMNEKLGQEDAAFNNLMLTLEANPFFEKAALKLGNKYREQNKRAQALLLYNLYLMFSPDGDRSFAVLKMANSLVATMNDLDGKIYDITEDDSFFDTCNLIIESQLPLKDDFEITSDLTIPFTKQTYAILTQLNKQPFEGDSRLWSELIIPFYTWINDNNYFEIFSYTTAYSIENEDFKKIIKKKVDEIKEFLPLANTKWTQLSSKDKVVIGGKTKHILKNFEEGLITGLGEVNSQGTTTGDWEYFNDQGLRIAQGKFKDGQREGQWEWYHDTGVIKEIGQYNEGKAQGVFETYHKNGNKKHTINFSKGEFDGAYASHAETGALQETRQYVAGAMNGMRRFFYEADSDLVYYEYPIVNGKAEGDYKEYYPDGTISKTMTLVNDYSQGEEKLFHYNGQLSAVAAYTKGNYQGPFTKYHTTGEIETTGFYTNGKFSGEHKTFFPNGMIKEQTSYDVGDLEGAYLVYDRYGKLISDFAYKKGFLKEYTYFDKKGTVLVSEKRKSGELFYKGYDESRSLIAQGIYDVKGGKKGEWSFFNTYGVIKEKGMFEENQTLGAYTLYHPNGAKQDVSNYNEGVLDGYEVIYYPFGQIKSQSYYKEGLREGRMISYHVNGAIQTENYYHKGNLNGDQKYYDANGILTATVLFDYGTIVSETVYKKDGTILEKIDKRSPSEDFIEYHYDNGKALSNSSYKNGLYHGSHKEYDYYGNLRVEGIYINNKLDGPVTSYYASGGIKNKRLFAQDLLDGHYIQYYENGKVEDSTYYHNGLEKGFSTNYNKKGVKTGELFYVDGLLHGARTFYGEEKGAVQLIRYYDYGKLIGYSYLDTSGKELPMIALPQGTGKVVSYFSNGSKGRIITYKNGLNQGEYLGYYENGQLERKHSYVDDAIHGDGFTYYPNGKLKTTSSFFHGYKQGLQKSYYTNGSIEEESNYIAGQRDGERHYYNEQGKKTKTEVYFNGKVIESKSF